jgi:hypothetical protein
VRDSAIGHLQYVETSGHREHASEQTPKRDRHAGGVTNDQYVTPRTTLLDGHHHAHQCRDGLGARMSRHRMSAATRSRMPAVYWEMSQGNAQVGRYSLFGVRCHRGARNSSKLRWPLCADGGAHHAIRTLRAVRQLHPCKRFSRIVEGEDDG